MRNFIYVENGDDAIQAQDDAILFPVGNITRMDPINATSTLIAFDAVDGTIDTDKIVITHASLKNKEVMNAVVKLIQMRPKNGFTIMGYMLNDADGTAVGEAFPINNLDSTIAVENVQYVASS